MLALPSTAAAQSGAVNCPGGVGVSADQICIDVGGAGGELVIADEDSCTYINAWESNPGTPGYAGLCTEGQSRGENCDTGTDADPANTGGCFQIKPAPELNAVLNDDEGLGIVTGTFICGNTTGEDPKDTTAGENPGRDGCAIP